MAQLGKLVPIGTENIALAESLSQADPLPLRTKMAGGFKIWTSNTISCLGDFDHLTKYRINSDSNISKWSDTSRRSFGKRNASIQSKPSIPMSIASLASNLVDP